MKNLLHLSVSFEKITFSQAIVDFGFLLFKALIVLLLWNLIMPSEYGMPRIDYVCAVLITAISSLISSIGIKILKDK